MDFINKRVCITRNHVNFFAVVRYIGPIEGKEGSFVGIEWEDESRGMHNGTYKGKVYFTCRHEKSGSFLPIEKINFGSTMIEELKARYPCNIGGDTSTVVSLNELLINDVDVSDEVALAYPDIADLELEDNLISTWDLIFNLCLKLESLSSISLSFNKMLDLDDVHTQISTTLKTLKLNETFIPSAVILKFDTCFPKLSEFELKRNKLTSLPLFSNQTFTNLKVLNLQRNKISDWQEVNHLKTLSSLTTLLLDENLFTKIEYDGGFEVLEILTLSDCKLTFDNIAILMKFPKLAELSLARNPLVEEFSDIATARCVIVASFPKLKFYNNSEINEEERKEAEKVYVHHFAKEFFSESAETFNKIYPMYESFISKYGEPANPLLNVNTLNKKMIEITIMYAQEEPKLKKISKTTTISKLKFLVKVMFSISPRNQILHYIDPLDGREMLLKEDSRSIEEYDVDDGGIIQVSKK